MSEPSAGEFRCESMPLGALLESVAARTPAPGGGAAASIVAALAASLGRMVVNYSIGRKPLADHAALHERALPALAESGRRALELAAADARAYARLNELWKLDDRDDRKQREMSGAVIEAIEAPFAALNLALDMLRLLGDLSGRTNRQMASDLAIAAILANAAARAAAWNVRVNLPLLKESARAAEFEPRMRALLIEADTLTGAIEAECGS